MILAPGLLLAFTAPATGGPAAAGSSNNLLPLIRPAPAVTGATPFPTTAETTLLTPFAGGDGGAPPPPAHPVWWPWGGEGQQPPRPAEVEPPAPLPEEEEAQDVREAEGPTLAPRVYCFTKVCRWIRFVVMSVVCASKGRGRGLSTHRNLIPHPIPT